jgi:two-component SAPR family response regulator
LNQTTHQIELHLLLLIRKIVRLYEEAHNFTTAITYAQRYLNIDELAEEMHRQLIKLFGLTGDRAAVTRQFEQLSLILERELAVSPLEETRAIYESALR